MIFHEMVNMYRIMNPKGDVVYVLQSLRAGSRVEIVN